MSSRIDPVEPGHADEQAVNERLREAEESWWEDPSMLGVIARQPRLVEPIVSVFEAFFERGDVEPHIYELMRLKDAEINRCAYCASVRTTAVRDRVDPKEEALRGEVDEEAFTRRELLAVRLAERMAGDPNYIEDTFFDRLREAYTEPEIVELVFGCGILIFGTKFNVTMTLDTENDAKYPTELEYPLDDIDPDAR